MNPKKQKDVKENLESNDNQKSHEISLVDQLEILADIIIDIYLETEIHKVPK